MKNALEYGFGYPDSFVLLGGEIQHTILATRKYMRIKEGDDLQLEHFDGVFVVNMAFINYFYWR
jgi:hypothetical protein